MRWLPCTILLAAPAAAEPHRSWEQLPSSNGWGAVVVDLARGRPHHWRDHLFATEEPRWDAAGQEVWSGDRPEAVFARDLLFDAYFGVDAGERGWLVDRPVLPSSGWAAPSGDGVGGTGIIRIAQSIGALQADTWVFAPWDLPRSSMVLALELHNPTAEPVTARPFALANLHLGAGRPEPDQEIGHGGETILLDGARWSERGFAGVVVAQALPAPDALASWQPGDDGPNPYESLPSGLALTGESGDRGVHDDAVPYVQWAPVEIPAGGSAWFLLAFAHHGDPFAAPARHAELHAWIAGRDAAGIVADERAGWAAFQASLDPPPGMTADEAALFAQSAAVLRMAQVREDRAWLREWLDQDGVPRYHPGATLPAEVVHDGVGAVLASLPPGRWTYAWPRDGAYAIVGMALSGMHAEARAALRFLLDAPADRYRGWDELAGVPLPPYAISLCRHHGFGLEESDTREYVRATGDLSLAQERWAVLRDQVAGVIVALVEPETGLVAADSSIWETHWLGKERHWAYTSLTAARGLCSAADVAQALGEVNVAAGWRAAGRALRLAVRDRLVDADGLIASNLEELQAGSGYADAAVLDAVAMGLFDPDGAIAGGTLDGIAAALQTPLGPGMARNDDAWDDSGLSPWGGDYDAAEWILVDLRAALGRRLRGQTEQADALLDWVTAQSVANHLAIAETYDPVTGDYVNNAPMVGFGPGAWIAAVAHRSGVWTPDVACGAWPEDLLPSDDDDSGDDDDSADDDSADDDDSDDDSADDDSAGGGRADGCGCGLGSRGAWLLLLAVPGLRRRHRRAAGGERLR